MQAVNAGVFDSARLREHLLTLYATNALVTEIFETEADIRHSCENLGLATRLETTELVGEIQVQSKVVTGLSKASSGCGVGSGVVPGV